MNRPKLTRKGQIHDNHSLCEAEKFYGNFENACYQTPARSKWIGTRLLVNRKLFICGIASLLFVAGVGRFRLFDLRSRFPKADVPVDVFGNQKTLTAFLTADQITVERLHYREKAGDNPWKIASYDRDPPILLNLYQSRMIQRIFARESTYGWSFMKSCAPDYGVLLTAHSKDTNVRVALCFQCYMFSVYDSEDNNAKHVNREDDFVYPASRMLAGLMKQLFPMDPEIQKLK